MNCYKPSLEVTKEYILDNIPQEHIMSYYLGIPVKYDRRFRSPLRDDKHPTCTFSWYDGKLYYRDWAENMPKDCFNIVQSIFRESLPETLNRIARDFEIIDGDQSDLEKISEYKHEIKQEQRYAQSSKSSIGVKVQKFTKTDIKYLKSYHLNSDIVHKFNVFSPKMVWLNGQIIYIYENDNPALAYYFGDDERGHGKWKIYFYRKKEGRFLSNTSRINGWVQLPETGNHLVITKSLKDVMCLYKFGINSIAMQGESQMPYQYIIDELSQRFDKIFSLLDWDETGQRTSWKLRDKFNITPIFLTDGRFGTKDYGEKDFSDYLKANGIEKARQLVEKAMSFYNVPH